MSSNISTNKISTDEVYHITATGSVASTTAEDQGPYGSASPVLGVELVNTGTSLVYFNLDGANPSTAADRVLLGGERVFVARAAHTVNVYYPSGTQVVEVNFQR